MQDYLASKVPLDSEKPETFETAADREAIMHIKDSAGLIGKLYPVLIDKSGKIIDGQHRLKADPNWPTLEVKGIDSEESRMIARLVANNCRRVVPSTEKTEILRDLGRIYLKQGLHRNQLAKEISNKTGMSYRWVMKYIPSNLKVRPGLGGPKKQESFCSNVCAGEVENHVAEELKLLAPSQEKIANLSNYSNTKFATIILDKRYYSRFREAALTLGVNPDDIINNALIQALQKIERLAKKSNSPFSVNILNEKSSP